MGKTNRVEETNDSSTVSKLSMLKANYSKDGNGRKELEWFVKYERRTSLINRGYFIRVEAIQRLFNGFLSIYDGQLIQVVNLGAGFDPLFLCLLNKDSPTCCSSSDRYENCHFVEVDLDGVIRQKAAVIRSKIDSCSIRTEESICREKDLERIFPNYTLVACDLMDRAALKSKLLDGCGLNPERPTLFIAECVLNYLPNKAADDLLSILSQEFRQSSFLIYEQIEPGDKFGQTMLKHFESIKSPLLSIDTYPTVGSHVDRYTKLGFSAVDCWPIGHLYYNCLTTEDRRRIAELEMFDEYEMWHSKCAHYLITLASVEKEQQKRILQHFQIPHFDVNVDSIRQFSIRLPTKLHPISLSTGHFRRFAHRSALIERSIDGERTLFLFSSGGWGVGDRSRQSRLELPCLLNLDDLDVGSNCQVRFIGNRESIDHRLLDRCYHGLTPILDRRTFFVYGGRRSPTEASSEAFLLKLNDDLNSVDVEIIETKQRPPGRWRHSTVVVEKDSVVVCGGLGNENREPLSDCWRFSCNDSSWIRLADLPSAVHSHSTCFLEKERILIVVGGLMADDRISPRIQLFFILENRWTIVEAPDHFRRYGSVCFSISDSTSMVIGGASPRKGECHDAAVLKIRIDDHGTATVGFSQSYALDDSSEMMLMNHDAVFDQETKRAFVFGGGGNCFSFGTAFNDKVLEIDCSRLV